MPAKSVFDLINERLGVRALLVENPEVAQVGVTDVLILRDNGMRYAFVFVNLSTNNIFLRPRRPATTTAGIRVDPGVSVTVEYLEDMHLSALEWHAIASGAASDVLLLSIQGEPQEAAVPA